MQPRRRLVEHIERVTTRAALELRRELDALRLAAREFGRWLPQAQVADPDLPERVERAPHRRIVGKELECLVDRHREHVRDRLAAVGDLERLFVVARALADRAWRVHARQKQHLDEDETLALAVVAAAVRDVEREPSRVVAARPRELCRREQPADVIEEARCTSRGWSAASGRLASGRRGRAARRPRAPTRCDRRAGDRALTLQQVVPFVALSSGRLPSCAATARRAR